MYFSFFLENEIALPYQGGRGGINRHFWTFQTSSKQNPTRRDSDSLNSGFGVGWKYGAKPNASIKFTHYFRQISVIVPLGNRGSPAQD